MDTSIDMHDNNGVKYTFDYTGFSQKGARTAMTCGYGSCNWPFLCRHEGKPCILCFSIDASCGPVWVKIVIPEEEYVALFEKQGEGLSDVYQYRYDHFGFAALLHPDDIEQAKALIGDKESLFGTIREKDFYG